MQKTLSSLSVGLARFAAESLIFYYLGDVSNQLELRAHYQALRNSNRNTGALGLTLVACSVRRFGLAVRR